MKKSMNLSWIFNASRSGVERPEESPSISGARSNQIREDVKRIDFFSANVDVSHRNRQAKIDDSDVQPWRWLNAAWKRFRKNVPDLDQYDTYSVKLIHFRSRMPIACKFWSSRISPFDSAVLSRRLHPDADRDLTLIFLYR